MEVKHYKPKLWKRILGALGFKKYKLNYFYSMDFGSKDVAVEASGYYDKDGVLNIKSLKVRAHE